MLEKFTKDHPIVFVAYSQWLVSNYGRKGAMDAKVMANKIKYKVDEISS